MCSSRVTWLAYFVSRRLKSESTVIWACEVSLPKSGDGFRLYLWKSRTSMRRERLVQVLKCIASVQNWSNSWRHLFFNLISIPPRFFRLEFARMTRLNFNCFVCLFVPGIDKLSTSTHVRERNADRSSDSPAKRILMRSSGCRMSVEVTPPNLGKNRWALGYLLQRLDFTWNSGDHVFVLEMAEDAELAHLFGWKRGSHTARCCWWWLLHRCRHVFDWVLWCKREVLNYY